VITTGQKSRKADPFELLDAVTEHDSMIAERHLLRSLLKRCDAILRDVAIEARIWVERDSTVGVLRRDIGLAME